ncbi:MAG: hypothetical protein DRI71_05650 [Bacteroidetes bacterium]|nr:MAG: hypothetical protein DRI71_05650 [Bacteroidota bacterium]
MKNLISILSIIVLLFTFSCGGGSSSTKDESGIYEPKTQEQFVQILDDLAIKPYPGAEITGFKEGANSEMTYKVISEGNTNKAIMEYYAEAFENGLKDKSGWKKFMSTPISVIYMKGFDLNFSFALTSENAARESLADTENVTEYLTFMITLGDDSVSY